MNRIRLQIFLDRYPSVSGFLLALGLTAGLYVTYLATHS